MDEDSSLDALVISNYWVPDYGLSADHFAPAVCGLSDTRHSHEPRENNLQKKSEEKWSSLPVLLIWMIKDKLDFFENTAVANVCRDWRAASLLYPNRHQSLGDAMPWLMKPYSDMFWASHEFINVTTGNRFAFKDIEYLDCKLLFSNRGWFLLDEENSPLPRGWFLLDEENSPQPRGRAERLRDSLTLVNPFMRSSVKVPDLGEKWKTCQSYCGSFSVRENNPHCIVLGKRDKVHQVTFATAYVGDQVWTEHSYDRLQGQLGELLGLGITGQLLYCSDFLGTTIIYNMSSQVWKEESAAYGTTVHLVEWEKRLVKVVQHRDHHYEFFSYNDSDSVWERLSNDDFKDTSWLLQHGCSGFTIRRPGSLVYSLGNEMSLRVTIYDLENGSKRKLPYELSSSAAWADIG